MVRLVFQMNVSRVFEHYWNSTKSLKFTRFRYQNPFTELVVFVSFWTNNYTPSCSRSTSLAVCAFTSSNSTPHDSATEPDVGKEYSLVRVLGGKNHCRVPGVRKKKRQQTITNPPHLSEYPSKIPPQKMKSPGCVGFEYHGRVKGHALKHNLILLRGW